MVKRRMGLLDLRIQAAKLNATLSGAQVTNIYDAHNGRTYILKLSVPPFRANPNSSSTHSSWEKRLLLIESGVRVHMTQYDREKDVPSGFCLKLRKHIRTRRLVAIRQLGDGGDRIVDLVFSGEGVVCAHLIVEVFSGGNVILTDANYSILTLLRTYSINSSSEEPTRVAVRERYPVENARPYSELTFDAFYTGASRARAAIPSSETVAAASGRAARRKVYARGVAKKALAAELSLEPSLLEHALLCAGFDGEASLHDVCDSGEEKMRRVYDAITSVEKQLMRGTAAGEMKGFIISKTVDGPNELRDRFDEFSPFLFAQYEQRSFKEYARFDEAADEFFSRVETERVEDVHAKREASTFKKVDKLESELNGQVTAFENARDKSWEMAQAIENNITEVEAALTVIRSAIAASVPWDGLARMVQDEKRNGNPVAEIIHSLQFDRNQMTLMLEDTFGLDDEEEEAQISDNDDEEDDGDSDDDLDDDEDASKKVLLQHTPETRKALLVPVDINLSAHANARRHYELRKSAAAKMEKAAEVKDRTVKAASKKAATEAKRLEEKAVARSIRAMRRAFWFEKFYWFISSEDYLVVAGRDAQTNDLLVKRYLGPGDVYVHADLDGASSVIVKNRKPPGTTKHSDIPQMTLEQAGTFAMCRSAAWGSKIVTSAWWVRSNQLSKTSHTGEYLPIGSFAIRGKKNFLNPTQLVMGLAFMFKIDDASAKRHEGERGVPDFGRDRNEVDDFVQDKTTIAGPSAPQDAVSLIGSLNLESPNNLSTPVEEESVQNSGTTRPVLTTSSIDEGKPSKDSDVKPGEGPMHENDVRKAAGERSIETGKDVQEGKKRMSAKERRTAKNNRDGGTANSSKQNERGFEAQSSNAGSKPKVGNVLPRGKKHKLKKMKKYSDQDEDERKIALAVLGSKPIKEEIGKADTGQSNKNPDDDDLIDDLEDSADRSQKQGSSREAKEEDLRLNDAEGLEALQNLEVETIYALAVLTAVPSVEDAVEFALPVCAPYSALSQYRYRVKMLPGNTKRGNAYRSAAVLFQKQAEKDLENFKQERDAMRLTPDGDGVRAILGNVKLMGSGLAEAQKMLAKSKKSSAAAKKGGKQK